jgi:hypothetical protein
MEGESPLVWQKDPRTRADVEGGHTNLEDLAPALATDPRASCKAVAPHGLKFHGPGRSQDGLAGKTLIKL